MKTAQPASLPPGPRSSGGIRRSTAASTKEASSDVKNIQGPGRTNIGGLASPGCHGIPPVRVRARPAVVPAKSSAAVETSSERRDSLDENRVATIGSYFQRESWRCLGLAMPELAPSFAPHAGLSLELF